MKKQVVFLQVVFLIALACLSSGFAFAQDVTLMAPEGVLVDEHFEVRWSGPDKEGDYITIVSAEAPDGFEGDTVETSAGNPVELTAPDHAGLFEIRYVDSESGEALGARSLTVGLPEASLQAPANVTAGAPFTVAWQGPNQKDDFVTIVAADADVGSYDEYAYTADGNPATLTAPNEPGVYEVRYVFGSSEDTLASETIRVD